MHRLRYIETYTKLFPQYIGRKLAFNMITRHNHIYALQIQKIPETHQL